MFAKAFSIYKKIYISIYFSVTKIGGQHSISFGDLDLADCTNCTKFLQEKGSKNILLFCQKSARNQKCWRQNSKTTPKMAQFRTIGSLSQTKLHRAGFGMMLETGLVDNCGVLIGWILGLEPLVVLLETGHYAKVRLALGTMIFCLSSQYSAVRVNCVPTEVASKRRTWSHHWAMTRTWIFQRELTGGGGLKQLNLRHINNTQEKKNYICKLTNGEEIDLCSSSVLTRKDGSCKC